METCRDEEACQARGRKFPTGELLKISLENVSVNWVPVLSVIPKTMHLQNEQILVLN